MHTERRRLGLAGWMWMWMWMCLGALAACSPAAPMGPRILLSPEPDVRFGEVAFFGAGIAHPTTVRKLVVFNMGSAPLRIDDISITAETPDSSGLELLLPEGFSRDGASLEPTEHQNFLEVGLRFTPESLGPKRWTLKVASNDPRKPTSEVAITAQVVTPRSCQFTVSPSGFDFAALSAPTFADFEVAVRNEGSDPVEQCLLSHLELIADEGSPFSLTTPAAPQVLAAGEQLKLTLRAQGISPGVDPQSWEATLQFQMGPGPSAPVTVPIRMSHTAADCLVAAPSALDFGEVAAECSSATRTFDVYNTCSSPVFLQGVSLTGSGLQPGEPGCPGTSECPEFHLESWPEIPVGGLEMPSGASAQFRVEYRPLRETSGSGTVTLEVLQGKTRMSYLVPFNGKGVRPSIAQTDHFLQAELPLADVLFVIDNSPSMASQQTAVATNLSAYLQYVQHLPVDFHLAAITADPAAGATFLSGPSHPDKVLSAASTDLDSQFAAKVDVGSNGSGSPACLDQALAALTPPLLTGANAGFLRPGAALLVVCITDTTDHSPRSVAAVVDDLWAIKGTDKKSLFAFNAVGGFTAACPGDQGRLAEAVSLTGGATADLCASDWHTGLEVLGTTGERPQLEFFLTSLVDATKPIEIEIDGQPVPATDARGGTVWTYDPDKNSVRFDPSYMPGGGQLIDISYFTPACP